LIECLLTRERLAALGSSKKRTQVSVTAAELQGYLPSLGDKADGLAKMINDYLAAPNMATFEQWDEMVEEIVSACHHEIQHEEWPKVVACAIEQEYQWGRYRKSKKPPTDPYNNRYLAWIRAKGRPDEVLVNVANKALAEKKIPPFVPGEQVAGSFVDEIPDTVLDELGALAAIRLGKGILDSIPNDTLRGRVEGNPLYKYPFKWFAPLFYNWARMRRTQPDTVVVFNTAIPVFCLTILAFDILLVFLRSNLLGSTAPGSKTLAIEMITNPTWLLLWLVPVVLLYVWARFFRR
jgi:hypothetical protein